MKTFLLASLALFALQMNAHAAATAPAEDELVPADQLATMDGLDLGDSSGADDALWPPPPHHPVPPPYPHPYPHPHPFPPPAFWYECSSEDQQGRVYTGRGQNPVYLQRGVHNRCEELSGAYCSDLGCRRI